MDLGARLSQARGRGFRRLAVIGPAPDQDWTRLIPARVLAQGLELIVILPETGRRRSGQRHPANVILVSDSVHPRPLAGYLASVAALRAGHGSLASPPASQSGPFSPVL